LDVVLDQLQMRILGARLDVVSVDLHAVVPVRTPAKAAFTVVFLIYLRAQGQPRR
jgi:hypothetical protein